MTDSKYRFTALQRPMWGPLRELSTTAQLKDGSVEQRLKRLEEDLAIKDLMNRYTYFYDSSDLESVMSIFHSDCRLVNPRGTYLGIEAIRNNYRFIIASRKFSFHHLTNPIVRLSDDSQEAGYGSYFYCTIVFRSGAFVNSSGSYAVRLVRPAKEWKIIECRITLNTRAIMTPTDASFVAPVGSPDETPPPPPPDIKESTRDWIGPGALA